jgi:DNA invertase Pin-like site-specific DNA recombinase
MEQGERIVRDYIPRGYVAKVAQSAMPITKTKLRVAAYCRVSTGSEEQLNSFKNQVAHYTVYIKSNPEWEYVDTYADEGLSGLKARKREQFQRLIRDALAGDINLIIVKSVSRFSRNTLDFLQTIRDLRAIGVGVYFEEQNINSIDPNNDFILNVHAGIAEQESRNISKNVRWGKEKKRLANEVTYNFNHIYGYRQDKDKNITIVEDEAEIIRDMYFKYLMGHSYKTIAADLAERGIKSPLGSEVWNLSTIKGILENEKYDGNVIMLKYHKADMHDAYAKRNTEPTQIAYNNHARIVSHDTWEAVQAERERRKNLRSQAGGTGTGRYDARYPFSGILYCECGATYRRHMQYICGKEIPAWVCKKHNKDKQSCRRPYIRESYLEQVFVRTLNGLIKSRESIISVVESVVGDILLDNTEIEDESGKRLSAVEAEIACQRGLFAELQKKRTRREIEAAAYNDESCVIQNRLEELFAQHDALLDERGAAQLDKAVQEMFADFFSEATEQKAFDKEVFMRLVKAVKILSKDDIIFKLRDGIEIKGDTADSIAA